MSGNENSTNTKGTLLNLDQAKKPQAKKDSGPKGTGKKTLNETDQRVASFIEQKFWETGLVPTNEVVALNLGVTEKQVQKCWSEPVFRKALIARGVDLDPDSTKHVLTPTQTMLANLLLNAHDKRSVREKLEQLEISSQQYHAWLRQPAFADYLRKRAEKLFEGSDHVAYMSLLDSVEDGDLQATKLFMEIRGIYNPRMQVDVNVEQVVVKVVEIVAKHVDDPRILEAIASDIEELDMGNRRAALSAGGL